MKKDRKPKDPEIIDNNPPLQEITPETEEEKKRKRDRDAVIRQNILDKFKEKEQEDKDRKREEKKKKVNKTRKCDS